MFFFAVAIFPWDGIFRDVGCRGGCNFFFALYIARLLLFSKYFFLEGRGRGVGKFHFLLFISKAISLLVFCCCFLFFFSMNEGIL